MQSSLYYFAIMQHRDLAGEWREIAERYHGMTDEEIIVLARQSGELTEIAQQALTQEMSYRKLKVPRLEEEAPPQGMSSRKLKVPPVEESPLGPEPEDPDDPYAEERKLVEVRTVWSLRDALQLQFLLDRAGIPFFMGREKATGVDAVTSDFTQGVSVRIMSIGGYWAYQAMQNYFPVDEPVEEPQEELEEIPVRCPKCKSTDVVIGRLVSEVAATKGSDMARFEWKCDACGYEWEDDGIVKE